NDLIERPELGMPEGPQFGVVLPQGQAFGIALFKFGHGPRAQRIGPNFVNHGLVLHVTGESGRPSHTAPPAPTFVPRSQRCRARRALLRYLSLVYRVCQLLTQLHPTGETNFLVLNCTSRRNVFDGKQLPTNYDKLSDLLSASAHGLQTPPAAGGSAGSAGPP